MASPAGSDRVKFIRPSHLPGVELVAAAYRDRSFPEHSHSEFVVGAVVSGAETLAVGNRRHTAHAGDVLHLNPDEPHANQTIGAETLAYQVFYLPDPIIRPFLKSGAALSFGRAVTQDRSLFGLVSRAFAGLASREAGVLEQETILAALVDGLSESPSSGPQAAPSLAKPSPAISKCRDHIDSNYAEGFGLKTLAELSGLSVFHLVRRFKSSIGLSPLAYRNQRRVMEARGRLLTGQPIVQVALDVGYADQSHLTRQFQRVLGVSPRRYLQQ